MVWAKQRRGLFKALTAAWMLLCPAVHAATVEGIAWHDLDRDGLRAPHEPRLAGLTAFLMGVGPTTNDVAAVTDGLGRYLFSGMPAGQYQLYVEAPSGFGITRKGAGPDTVTDSDLVLFSYFPPASGRTATFSYNGTAVTNLDAGFVTLQPAMSARAGIQGVAMRPVFATNGTVITRSCIISNSGDTALSFLSVYDQTIDAEIGSMDCPGLLAEGHVITFSDTFTVTNSTTNTLTVVAIPINPITCETLDLDPLFAMTQTVVIVVQPGSASDVDGDGATDWEEFVAGTDGADAASRWSMLIEAGAVTITPSATSRLYQVYATTNLADGASWQALAAEQSGTGGALPFAVTNLPASAVFRAAARMP